mmetsp:Transcript_31587/g.102028  ORF Transcript_31587/g.102028 Transcript_31587/m.102028 type:complete len:91 (+) Transcript_31587:676-948(+)
MLPARETSGDNVQRDEAREEEGELAAENAQIAALTASQRDPPYPPPVVLTPLASSGLPGATPGASTAPPQAPACASARPAAPSSTAACSS